MNTSLIQSNPQIMMGKPVIAGTRITVESILERLGAGEKTREQIMTAHLLAEEHSAEKTNTFTIISPGVLRFRNPDQIKVLLHRNRCTKRI